jgi:hypothetical protein
VGKDASRSAFAGHSVLVFLVDAVKSDLDSFCTWKGDEVQASGQATANSLMWSDGHRERRQTPATKISAVAKFTLQRLHLCAVAVTACMASENLLVPNQK